MATFSSANPSHLFIDLATFSEIEGFLYGGPDAITWFVAAVQKANWFSYIPIVLRQNGVCDFSQRGVSASVNRSGDYVMSVWFRVRIPKVVLLDAGTQEAPILYVNSTIRWTRFLMHNLIERCNISFNELVVHEFDSHWLDFRFQFQVDASKRIGYRNMVGDIASMTTPVPPNTPLGTGGFFNVPLPFFFGEDTGLALAVAALPFNDIKINYTFRPWQSLIIVYPGTNTVAGTRVATTNDVFIYGQQSQKPILEDPQTHAHYAVVHNDERVKMGDAPRDILIHQIQNTQYAPFKDISSRTTFDIRMSHSIVSMFFGAQNVSLLMLYPDGGGEWSNYTTEPNYAGLSPIAFSTLVYENTVRLSNGIDYYALVLPYYMSISIPDDTGYNMWSYSVKPWDPLRPAGSTNYSKLANVSISHDMSLAALHSAGIGTTGGLPEDKNGQEIQYPDSTGSLQPFPQKYRHILIARNWNIGRIANGLTYGPKKEAARLSRESDINSYFLVSICA